MYRRRALCLTASVAILCLASFTSSQADEPAAANQDGSITVEAMQLSQGQSDFPIITGEDLPGAPDQTFDVGIGDIDHNNSNGIKVSWERAIAGRTWRLSAFTAKTFSGAGTFFDLSTGESTNTSYAQAAGRTVDTENSEQAHAYEFRSSSRIAGFEANLVSSQNVFKVLVGARTFFYNYSLSSVAYDSQASFQGAGTDIDRVSISGKNIMAGPQIGVDITIPVTKQLRIEAESRLGLFANAISTKRSFTSDDNPLNVVDTSPSALRLAHALEFNPRVVFSITDRLTLTAGGTFLWLDNIAEASTEYRIASVGNRGVLGDGHVFVYGGTFGLTYKFASDKIHMDWADLPTDPLINERETDTESESHLTVEAVALRARHGKFPLTTADDDTQIGIGREATTDDATDGPMTGLRATLDRPRGKGILRTSAFIVGMSGDTKTEIDAARRTSPAYTFATGRDVSVTNSVGVYAITVSNEDRLASGEINYVRPLNWTAMPSLSIIAGARGIYHGYDLTSVAFAEADDFSGTDNDIDRVSLKGHNLLFGPQIGIEGKLHLMRGIILTGTAKAGLHANFMSGRRSFRSDDDITNTVASKHSETALARSLEFGARLEIPITESTSFTASASALWLDGVLDAAHQYRFATDAAAGLQNDGHALYYGGTAGLTVKLN